MSPAASRRFRVRLKQCYVAEIDAPNAAAAQAITRFLIAEGLWESIFSEEDGAFDISDCVAVGTEVGQ